MSLRRYRVTFTERVEVEVEVNQDDYRGVERASLAAVQQAISQTVPLTADHVSSVAVIIPQPSISRSIDEAWWTATQDVEEVGR